MKRVLSIVLLILVLLLSMVGCSSTDKLSIALENNHFSEVLKEYDALSNDSIRDAVLLINNKMEELYNDYNNNVLDYEIVTDGFRYLCNISNGKLSESAKHYLASVIELKESKTAYDDGVNFEANEDYENAIQSYSIVIEQDSNYVNAQERLIKCREVFSKIPTQPPTERATIPPALSSTCDMILASGYEGADYYELVANETEDYQGVIDEVGVIKNNEWLLKPTTDMPLVQEEGNFYQANSIYNINSGEFQLLYVGNGCFYYYRGTYGIIYNSNTNKAFSYHDTTDRYWMSITMMVPGFYGYKPDFSYMHKLSLEDSILIYDVSNYGYKNGADIMLLDTNTMENKTIRIVPYFDTGYVYPVSDNVFAVANNYSNHNKIAFFDTNGNMLFDSSDFSLRTTQQSIVFENGECTFEILNNSNTPYSITINKSGEVVRSSKI